MTGRVWAARPSRRGARTEGAHPTRVAALARHPDAVVLAGFLVASLLFYYPLVLLGRAVVDYDAFVYFYPQRAYLAESLLEGRVPLWNPYLFLGAPFLANPQAAVLYPPSWLFVLGPVWAIYSLQLVLHTFLAAAFMYLLARHSFGASAPAAAVGGLAYGFSGFLVGQVGHLNQLSAAAWLPAVLLAYDRAVVRRSPAWAGVGALTFGVQLLAGHPQESYMTALLLVLFGLVRAPWRQPLRLVWAGVAGALVGLAGVVVAAAQLLPTLELSRLSVRGQGVEWADAVAGSLPHWLMVRALFPPYWVDVPTSEYVGYVGVVPVALGFLALLAARSLFVVFGFVACFLGLFLAAGENNGYYGLLFATAPGFDTFRVPARWLFLWTFGAATLAALGAEWLWRGARVTPRRPATWARVLLVALVLATGLAWQRDYGEEFGALRIPALWAALAGLTVGLGALAALGWRRLAVATLVGIAAVELFAAAGWSPMRKAPPAELIARVPAAAEWLRADAYRSARLLSIARPSFIPEAENELRRRMEGLPEEVMQALIVAYKWQASLIPNLPLQYGLRSADGYDGGVLPLARYLALSTLLIPPDEVRPDGVLYSRIERPPDGRLLELLGIDYVLANEGVGAPPDWIPVDVGDLRLLAKPVPAPKSLLVFAAAVVEDEVALQAMADRRFEPGEVVVVAPGPGAAILPGVRPATPVQPLLDEPERWRALVSVPEPAYLLQREAWYPGWRARVDGVETPLVRANLLFRAVPLVAGEHEVEVYFDSTAHQVGRLISGFGLLLAAALTIVAPVWRRLLPIIRRRRAA